MGVAVAGWGAGVKWGWGGGWGMDSDKHRHPRASRDNTDTCPSVQGDPQMIPSGQDVVQRARAYTSIAPPRRGSTHATIFYPPPPSTFTPVPQVVKWGWNLAWSLMVRELAPQVRMRGRGWGKNE